MNIYIDNLHLTTNDIDVSVKKQLEEQIRENYTKSKKFNEMPTSVTAYYKLETKDQTYYIHMHSSRYGMDVEIEWIKISTKEEYERING